MKLPIKTLREQFAHSLKVNEPLSGYTSARVGGRADALVVAGSVEALEQVVRFLWEKDLPFIILGGGSNVLVSDAGCRGLVVLNRARQVVFAEETGKPSVWAESGANFGSLARQACRRGLSGLEWAVGVPGTVGGAVVGNAGAHGGDIAGCLMVAEILHHYRDMDLAISARVRQETWTPERLEFSYRGSKLKDRTLDAVVLGARFQLAQSSPDETISKSDEFTAYRHQTQPPGATMGSMFKNPPGDYAGRLVEAVGLKGTRIGDAEISPQHANFFINHGRATASDIYQLIELARKKVKENFEVELELEIELVGDWQLERTAG